jgi:hypothetical protein
MLRVASGRRGLGVDFQARSSNRWLITAAGFLFKWLGQFQDDFLMKQAYWARLTFIAVHLRNERDGLGAAQERLKEDLAVEQSDKQFRRELAGDVRILTDGVIPVLHAAALVAFFVALADA